MPESAFVARAAPSAEGLPPVRYDFARPPTVSARGLRAAEAVHAALAGHLAAALADALGEPATVRARGTHDVLAVDVARSRRVPTALATARLEGGAELLVDVEPALALFLVERQLGGRDPLGTSARALSALEAQLVLRHALPLVADAFSAAWGVPPPAAAGLAASAAAPVDPEAPVVVAEFEVVVGGGQAALTLVYPAEALRALVAAAAATPPTEAPAGPRVALDGLPLEVRAELGRTRLSVARLLALAPGDVLPLDRPADGPLPVWIGPRLRAEARPGQSGARLALDLLAAPAPTP